MHIPKKIKIGGHTIKVKRVKKDIAGVSGLWESEDNTIYIYEELTGSMQYTALLRGIFGAMNTTTESSEDEYLIQMFYQIFTDNPNLLDIPEKIKVGGHIIEVQVTEFRIQLDINDGEITDRNADGFWDPRFNRIYINPRLPKNQQGVTLIHEILHVIDSDLEHETVEYIAQDIYQVIKDNNLLSK